MTFILKRTSPYLLASLPFKFFSNNLDKPVHNPYFKLESNTHEKGVERVRKIFSSDEDEEITPELQHCFQLSTMAFMIGGIYGGMIRGRSAFISFIDTNEASMFRSHLDAKRKLQDSVALSYFKGFFQWSWRCSFFTTIYVFTSTIIAVYRGESGILEHIYGASLAGALYNSKNGFRGVIVGGALGGALGLIFGTVIYLILAATGRRMEDVRFWTYEYKLNHEKLVSEAARKRRQEKEMKEYIQLDREINQRE